MHHWMAQRRWWCCAGSDAAGKIILRLTIEPDGSVSLCQLHASNMEAPDLAAQVVERVKTFNFGAKVVPPVTIIYPIDFLPTA